MEDIIEAEDISFSYGGCSVFSNISFSVERGDFAAVIGSNGSGKSTLMRLILNEAESGSGSIRLFNQDIRHFKGWSKIGYVPQNVLALASGFPATAEEIVKANLFGDIGLFRFPKKKHHEKALAALQMVGMEGLAKKMIGEMSGGQQQRVMIARTLVSNPKLMLLDEPATGIDSETVDLLYKLLSRLNREKGLTIVMVTHDILRASKYVSRVLCLEEGSLVELDKCQVNEELSHRHKHPERNSGKKE